MIESTNNDFQETQKYHIKLFMDLSNLDFTIPNKDSNVLQQQQIKIAITELKNNTLSMINNLQDQYHHLQITIEHITQLLSDNIIRLNEIISSLENNVLEDNLLSQIVECYNYQKNQSLISQENKFGQGLFKAYELLNALENLNNNQFYCLEHKKYNNIFKKEIELLNNKKWEEAHMILEKRIIQIKNILSYAQYFNSMSLMELNQPGKGIKLKEKSQKNNGNLIEDISKETDQFLEYNNSNKFINLFIKCLTLEDQNNFELAIQISDQILQLDQLNIQALYKKSKFLVNLEQTQKAIPLIDQVLQINPNYVLAINLKGVILEKQRCFEESIQYFDKAFNIDNSFVTALFNKGGCLQDLENNNEAIKCYDLLIKINPKNYLAHYNRSITLVDLQRYEEALTSYDQTIFLNPNYLSAYYNKGIVLNSLKRNKEAILCFDKVISVEPNHAKSYLNKGYSLSDLGQFNEALEHYEKAIQIDPLFLEAYYNKGILFDDLKKYEDAIRCYDEVIKLDPNDSQSYYNKAISLQNLKRDEEAILCYDMAIKLNPSYDNAYNNKGLLLEKLGKKKQAIQNYKAAIKKCIKDQTIFSKRIKRLKNKQ